MATSDMEIKVSLEKALHAELKQFAADYYREYGVMIERISFDWYGSVNNHVLLKVSVDSSSC